MQQLNLIHSHVQMFGRNNKRHRQHAFIIRCVSWGVVARVTFRQSFFEFLTGEEGDEAVGVLEPNQLTA